MITTTHGQNRRAVRLQDGDPRRVSAPGMSERMLPTEASRRGTLRGYLGKKMATTLQNERAAESEGRRDRKSPTEVGLRTHGPAMRTIFRASWRALSAAALVCMVVACSDTQDD